MAERQFPHLNDTAFPNLSNADPYSQYKVNFDYTRWGEGTKILVCNVPWDGAQNIVKWEDDDSRNKWFDELTSGVRERLSSAFQIKPDGLIKLPIPFDAMSRYNYVWVEFPLPTSEAEMIDYAGEPRTSCWGFFASQPVYIAPNTTQVTLDLDMFTTFGNHIQFQYAQLKRGHAPLAAIDADTYLANPIDKAGMLLTPDVSYGEDAGVVRDHRFYPMGSGEKYVMFSSLIPPDEWEGLGKAVEWGDDHEETTAPEYYDTQDRWGHQWGVRGYDWNLGPADYSNLDVPSGVFTADGVVPTKGFVYCVKAVDADKLFSGIVKWYPQVMQTIQGMWVVPGDFISVGESVLDIDGVELLKAE